MHFADVWEAIADAIPEARAVVQGDRLTTWRDFEHRAARLASAFTDAGLDAGAKVGIFLYNSPEYLETQFAAFKQRLVPINVNYRYLDDELLYLLDNADCEAIVFHASLADRIGRIAHRLDKLRLFIQVTDHAAPDAPLIDLSTNTAHGTRAAHAARAYEEVIASAKPADRLPRSEDDIYMLYTGGTTGMPKGVMYPMGALTDAFAALGAQNLGLAPFESMEALVSGVTSMSQAGHQPVSLPCCPLMHGTGVWLGAFTTHLVGGCCALLQSRGLDPVEILDAIETNSVNLVVLVGDAFARPLLRALDARAATGASWDLSSVAAMISSGAMFSHDTKSGLLEHIPQMRILDMLGSTEGGMGAAVSSKEGATATASFTLTPTTKVFDEDDNDVVPGSGVIGRVATASAPLGYYKDPEKSARTFREVRGVRYSFPGDMAMVAADGSLVLLGRGSHCINTGGEKVFPEEVEEAVKTHATVRDCLVFGIEDDRFGQRVVGVVSAAAGDGDTDTELIIAHTKQVLSGYKVPKQLVVVPEVPRAPNGKADYQRAREMFSATT